MKSLLKVSAAVMMLAVMAAAMVLFFGSMERSRGQPAALAPTATPQAPPPILTNLIITPTVSLTPRPFPSVIVDPIWPIPTPRPTVTPAPTPTPRPATGGPYISEARAIEIALASARGAGQVDQSIPPKTLFTTAKEIPAILGKPRKEGSIAEREYWVVYVYGSFKTLHSPGGIGRPGGAVFREARAIIDATTGQIDIWGLQDGQ